MQRNENGYVVISCDFTGIDWDEIKPMIEGHQGSVISLEALKMAIPEAAEAEEDFKCVMCLREFDAGTKSWSCKQPLVPTTANLGAVICWDCIQQADRAFANDKDTEWERQIEPTDRWR